MTTVVRRKYKMSRRINASLWGRPKDPVHKRNYPPGQHGRTSNRRSSDFGKQGLAQRCIKHYYAVKERHFSRLYKMAYKLKGHTVDNLVGLLESRLSAVVYNSGLVPTIFAAKQLVAHRHVTVNDKIVNISSYRVKIGDIVEIRDRAKNLTLVTSAIETKERDVPDYVEVDANKRTVRLIRVPKYSEVPYPAQMNLHLIIEFYSR